VIAAKLRAKTLAQADLRVCLLFSGSFLHVIRATFSVLTPTLD
jgi:hypothetical protein